MGSTDAREIARRTAAGNLANLPTYEAYAGKIDAAQYIKMMDQIRKMETSGNGQQFIQTMYGDQPGQRVASEVRIVHYIEGTQRTLADYSADLKALRLDGQPINWGYAWLPHDGFAKRHQSGKSDATVLGGLGWDVRRVPQTDVEAGIKRAREVFPRVWFNKERAARLIECLKRYRRHVSTTTGEPGKPMHDEFSHGADAYRYLAMCADDLTNDSKEWDKPLKLNTKYIV